jgi:hypothetical protein
VEAKETAIHVYRLPRLAHHIGSSLARDVIE